MSEDWGIRNGNKAAYTTAANIGFRLVKNDHKSFITVNYIKVDDETAHLIVL